MSRYRTPTNCVDPEVEEFRLLNSKVEENRRQDQITADHVNAILRKQEKADLVAAKKRRQRRIVRKYRSQMNALADRIILCLLCFLGVYLLWLLGWLSAELLYLVALICTYKIASLFSTAWDMPIPQGGDTV